MKRLTERLPAGTLFFLLAAIVFWMILFGCRSIPVPESIETKDSTWTEQKTVPVPIAGDSSWATYLIECQQTNEGLRAVISSLEDSRSGTLLAPPNASIDNNVLSVNAKSRDTVYYPLVTVTRSKTVVSKVFVKITNEKTGGEWFQIYGFRWHVVLDALILLFFFIKNKWYTILITLGIDLFNKLKKKK